MVGCTCRDHRTRVPSARSFHPLVRLTVPLVERSADAAIRSIPAPPPGPAPEQEPRDEQPEEQEEEREDESERMEPVVRCPRNRGPRGPCALCCRREPVSDAGVICDHRDAHAQDE